MSVLPPATWALLCLVLLGCDRTKAEPSKDAVVVEVMAVTEQPTHTVERSFPGTVRAAREGDWAFDRPGRLVEVRGDVGAAVRRGDLLARLDPSMGIAAARRQRAARTAAAVELRRAEAAAARVRALEGAATGAQRDEASLSVEAARARLAQADAALAEVQTGLGDTRLKAPFDGVVVARHLEPGMVVAPGQPVLTLRRAGRHEVTVGVPDRYRQPTAEVEVLVGDRRHRAEVVSVGERLDRTTGTRELVLALPAGVGTPGQSVQVVLGDEVDEEGIWLPRAALTAGERGLWTVYAVDGDDRIERHAVEIVHRAGARVFVRGTLRSGDRVVAHGLHRVVPGQRVAVAAKGEAEG